MSDSLPDSGYLQDLARTVTEMRTAMENIRTSIFQTLGRAPRSELTLASGEILPDRVSHTVDTESDLEEDDLTDIDATNVPDGFWLILSAEASGRQVTVKHDSGNIETLSGQDVVLNDFPRMIFEWYEDEEVWREVFITKAPGLPAGLVVASIAPYTTDQVWGVLGYARKLKKNLQPLLYAEVGDYYNDGSQASDEFMVPSAEDVSLVGRGDMSGSSRGLISLSGTGNPGLDTTLLGATAGSDRRTLSASNHASHRHSASGLSFSGSFSDTDTDTVGTSVARNLSRANTGRTNNQGSQNLDYMSWDSSTLYAQISISGSVNGSISGNTAYQGSANPFPILGPSMVVNYLYTTGLTE